MAASQRIKERLRLLAPLIPAILFAPCVLHAQAQQSQSQTTPDLRPMAGQLPPAQQPGVLAPGKTSAGEDKRIFGVLPNYRTAEKSAEYQPISAKRKLLIATKDSFDYPLVLLAAAYAGLYQLDDDHPQFGQGMEGYAKRLGTGYADQVIGNYMTEGFMPILLREDPRYFRLGEGTRMHRTLYALSRIFVTRTDSGGKSFNYAEIGGNAIGAGIGLSYYSDNRNVGDFMENWWVACGTDATSQVLKEFWPDVKRWWYNKHHRAQAATKP